MNDNFKLGILQNNPFENETLVINMCPICGDLFTVDKIITFDCDDKGCLDCVKEYLLARFEMGNWEFNIPCFNGICSKGYGLQHPDSTHVIKEILGQEKYEKMADKAAFDFANNKCANITFKNHKFIIIS